MKATLLTTLLGLTGIAQEKPAPRPVPPTPPAPSTAPAVPPAPAADAALRKRVYKDALFEEITEKNLDALWQEFIASRR
jgi:hypothetical protein